jgi:hypothetical protein
MSNQQGVTGPDAFRLIADEMERGGEWVNRVIVNTTGWSCPRDAADLAADVANGHPIRRKPETLTVQDHEIPMPLAEEPEIGRKYWVLGVDSSPEDLLWDGDNSDMDNLRARRAYATREDCEQAERLQAEARGGSLG